MAFPPQRSRRLARCGLVASALLAGCGDEVVGYFEGSGGGEGTSTSTSGAPTSDESSSTGPNGLVPPGCLADDFEDGEIDPVLWNTWIEQDAALVELGGLLKLTPPSFGIWDTGVVNAYNSTFPFEHGRVRVRVHSPPVPGHPIVLFLQVLDGIGGVLSIQLADQSVAISSAIDMVEQYGEVFPADPYPAWIAIRAEGELVHYETSDDGVTFTTLTTRDKLRPYVPASALIMAQTYGEDLERPQVAVDDFEVCVQ